MTDYTSHEVHLRYHAMLLHNMRSQRARAIARYEALPWWRKLVTRRPVQLAEGYSVLPWGDDT